MTSSNLLDQTKSDDLSSVIAKDERIIQRVILICFVFGLTLFLNQEDFVIPLPFVYAALPLIGIYFLFTARFSVESMLLLILPLIVLKDLILFFNYKWVEIVVFLVMICWLIWASFLVVRLKNVLSWIHLIGQGSVVLLLIKIDSIFPLLIGVGMILLTSVLFYRNLPTQRSLLITRRVCLMVQMISGLYIMNLFSALIN